MDEVFIEITFNGETYHFNAGSKAYIFHIGVYNEVHKKHGIQELLEYVELVDNCYLKDDNHTPLGDLADYIAIHFKHYRKMSYYKILENFYNQLY